MISNNLALNNRKIEVRRITQVRRVIVFFQNNQNEKKLNHLHKKLNCHIITVINYQMPQI